MSPQEKEKLIVLVCFCLIGALAFLYSTKAKPAMKQTFDIQIPDGIDPELYKKAWNKFRQFSFSDLVNVVQLSEHNIQQNKQDVLLFKEVEKWRISRDVSAKMLRIHLDPDAPAIIPAITDMISVQQAQA